MNTAPNLHRAGATHFCELCGEPGALMSEAGFVSCEDHFSTPIPSTGLNFNMFDGQPLPLRVA